MNCESLTEKTILRFYAHQVSLSQPLDISHFPSFLFLLLLLSLSSSFSFSALIFSHSLFLFYSPPPLSQGRLKLFRDLAPFRISSLFLFGHLSSILPDIDVRRYENNERRRRSLNAGGGREGGGKGGWKRGVCSHYH